jgi:LysM repeat protein
MRRLITAIILTTIAAFGTAEARQSLGGSTSSMSRQTVQASRHDFTFMESSTRVSRFVDAGLLVKADGNRNYELAGVSYPYVRPAVKLFVERLSSQFRAACGERLTVTSMTRPTSEQPRNSADGSVHPTGMAVDLRVPRTTQCRNWLNGVLLSLESSRVLEATRERNPPHYHVAVFPEPYEQYVASLGMTVEEYIVRRGDSLTKIAANTGTTVPQLRAANGIRGDMIQPGQAIVVPSPGDDMTHRVQRGETLSRIAGLYGTTVAAITSANGLSSDFIQVGQVLRVTAASLPGLE